MGDWARSTCPAYSQSHHETLVAFPPTAIINRFVAKAQADGIRAIVVTLLAVSDPYWSKLLHASVVNNEDGYLRVRRQLDTSSDSDVAGELAIFAVDLSVWSSRHRSSAPSPPCGLEDAFRGRNPIGSSADQEDRRRIRASLVQLGLPLG